MLFWLHLAWKLSCLIQTRFLIINAPFSQTSLPWWDFAASSKTGVNKYLNNLIKLKHSLYRRAFPKEWFFWLYTKGCWYRVGFSSKGGMWWYHDRYDYQGCTYVLTSFALHFVTWGLPISNYWYRPVSRDFKRHWVYASGAPKSVTVVELEQFYCASNF
jgi:hypothetical protein